MAKGRKKNLFAILISIQPYAMRSTLKKCVPTSALPTRAVLGELLKKVSTSKLAHLVYLVQHYAQPNLLKFSSNLDLRLPQYFLKSPYLFSQLALTDIASLPQLQRAEHIFSIRFCWSRRIMLKTKLIKNTWMISASEDKMRLKTGDQECRYWSKT
jgi:hypothetical protein